MDGGEGKAGWKVFKWVTIMAKRFVGDGDGADVKQLRILQ